jgi:hypothetical protein
MPKNLPVPTAALLSPWNDVVLVFYRGIKMVIEEQIIIKSPYPTITSWAILLIETQLLVKDDLR